MTLSDNRFDQRRTVSVLVGLQAAGKSTFSRNVLPSNAVRVSKDDFPRARQRQRRQLRLIRESLGSERDVVVDNTNPSPEEWQPIIAVAGEHGARTVAYWFPPDVSASYARNAGRPDSARVPDVGFYATLGRLRQPTHADGFDEVFTVRLDGAGGFDVQPVCS